MQGKQLLLGPMMPEDNKKIILCQAITPFTELHKGAGRSAPCPLNIHCMSTACSLISTE